MVSCADTFQMTLARSIDIVCAPGINTRYPGGTRSAENVATKWHPHTVFCGMELDEKDTILLSWVHTLGHAGQTKFTDGAPPSCQR